jgi:hypothetical protein
MPIYFEKETKKEEVIDAAADVEIFSKYIAPRLDITVRFAGSEPIDKVTMQYNLELRRTLTEFDIEFIIHSAFVESVGSTLTAVNIDTLWQVSGMEAKDLIYKQTSPTFKIYNDGNVLIDPRIVPLIITFKGASNNLSIKNITTGDEWTFSGTSNPDDSIILDGIRSTKNGLSIYRETNHKLITLIPGMNEFELTGATDPFEISFDFYFYYL